MKTIDVDIKLTKDEYEAYIRCRNCGKRYRIAVQKGHTILEVIDGLPCPNCGCYEMEKA